MLEHEYEVTKTIWQDTEQEVGTDQVSNEVNGTALAGNVSELSK